MEKTSQDTLKKILYSHCIIVAGAFIISAGFFIKKAYHTSLQLEQFLFYRFLSMALICKVCMWLTNTSARVPNGYKHLKWHYSIRSVLGFLGFLFFTISLIYIPISSSIALRYTSGLWTGFISYLLAKQYKKQIPQLICLGISFVGLVFIVRPSANMPLIGIIAGLLAGLSTGIAYFWVSLIGRYDTSLLRTIWIFSLYGTVFSLIVAVTRGHFRDVFFIPHEALVPVITAYILLTASQFFLSVAFSRGHNLLTSTLLYSEILLAFAADALFMGQTISGLDIIGIFIIIAGGITQNWLTKHHESETAHNRKRPSNTSHDTAPPPHETRQQIK